MHTHAAYTCFYLFYLIAKDESSECFWPPAESALPYFHSAACSTRGFRPYALIIIVDVMLMAVCSVLMQLPDNEEPVKTCLPHTSLQLN